MRISRRDLLLGSASALSAATLPFPKPAIAQTEPIKIGCLAAMTGPSSAPTIGFNRGVNFAADAINAAGGVKGRKIEIVMRDTQGDPTKAVNATQELISQVKVHAIWGPLNSGEALAVTPIMARAKMPDIHPCVVESLIDTNEISECVPHGAFDQSMGRRRPELLPQYPQGEKGCRDRRHHGLWRDRRRCVGGGLQEGRRRCGLSGQHQFHPARHDPGHAARQGRRRRSDRGLERLNRHGSANVQQPRGDELGRSVRRPSVNVLRRNRRAGRKARQLEKSLRHRLQELQLR